MIDKARKLAVLGLIKVAQSGYSNLVLNSLIKADSLDKREKNFATAIFYGSIERQITIDALVAPHLKIPLKKLDKEVLAILRTAAYQLLFMSGVENYAAIDEAVKLTKTFKKTSAASLVNAVLRKISLQSINDIVYQSEPQRLSVLYSVDISIAELLLQQYQSKAEEILQHSFYKQGLCVRVNTTKTTTEQLQARLQAEKERPYPTALQDALLLKNSKEPTEIYGFKEGLFHIVSQSSQLCALACVQKETDSVLDLCAAPGGKTATIAQLVPKGTVTACELHESRITLIRSLVSRLSLKNVTVCQNDGIIHNEELGKFDTVLVDAPCTGLGVLANKPDIRLKNVNDNQGLVAIQKALLNTAKNYLKDGGRLVYSTCTLNKQENQEIVDDFLSQNADFSKDLPEQLQSYNKDGYALILPNETTGFFIATLKRDNGDVGQ